MASVKDGLIIGGIILGAVILLPGFLRKRAVENTFALGADIQREITGGYTFAESLNLGMGLHASGIPYASGDFTVNPNAFGYLTPQQVSGAKTIKQDSSGNVYVNGMLVKSASNVNQNKGFDFNESIKNLKNFLGVK